MIRVRHSHQLSVRTRAEASVKAVRLGVARQDE
jgi:hypothetical protein